jgi:hypothetical protein
LRDKRLLLPRQVKRHLAVPQRPTLPWPLPKQRQPRRRLELLLLVLLLLLRP